MNLENGTSYVHSGINLNSEINVNERKLYLDSSKADLNSSKCMIMLKNLGTDFLIFKKFVAEFKFTFQFRCNIFKYFFSVKISFYIILLL